MPLLILLLVVSKPGCLSRYSSELRAGRPGFDSRQSQGDFLYYTESRSALGPKDPQIQWVQGDLSRQGSSGLRVKLITHMSSAVVKNGRAIIPLSICFHGIVLNDLSTMTASPLLFTLAVSAKE
jgi:hypothetical protein